MKSSSSKGSVTWCPVEQPAHRTASHQLQPTDLEQVNPGTLFGPALSKQWLDRDGPLGMLGQHVWLHWRWHTKHVVSTYCSGHGTPVIVVTAIGCAKLANCSSACDNWPTVAPERTWTLVGWLPLQHTVIWKSLMVPP